MSTPFAFKTYLTTEQVKNRGAVIASYLQSDAKTHTAFNDEKALTEYPHLVEKPYPIVLITNGVATCGKDTFVKCMMSSSSKYNGVAKLSTIDPVRDAVLCLYKAMDTIRYLFSSPPKTSAEVVAEKGDRYRDMLYDIKCAWEKDCSASMHSTGTVLATLISDRGENLSAICIDSRETETIDRIVSMLSEAGIIVLKVLITAPWTDTNQWQNGCDSNVCMDESYYDVVIHNDGSEDDLKHIAWVFTKSLERLNQCYGVSSVGSAGDTAALILNKPKEEEKEESAVSPMGFPVDDGDPSSSENNGTEFQSDGDPGDDSGHRVGDSFGNTLMDEA